MSYYCFLCISVDIKKDGEASFLLCRGEVSSTVQKTWSLCGTSLFGNKSLFIIREGTNSRFYITSADIV